MYARLELGAQLAIVVDLAVEDHLHIAVDGRHRLMPAGEIDDRQAAHAEQRALVAEEAFVVRTAVPDHVVHCLHDRHVDGG